MNTNMNKKYLLTPIFILFLSTHPSFGIEDEIASNLPVYVKEPIVHNNYNYEGVDRIPVKIHISSSIKSEKDIRDGEEFEFIIDKTVVYNKKVVLNRGEKLTAKVQIIITPGMNGIPASIIFNNFSTTKNLQGRFSNSYEIFGCDRSYFVFPLKWALTPFPPTGSLTNFIMGGHAKLKTNKQIVIYYYPEWS